MSENFSYVVEIKIVCAAAEIVTFKDLTPSYLTPCSKSTVWFLFYLSDCSRGG